MVVMGIVLKSDAKKCIMVSLNLCPNRPCDGPILFFRLYLFFVCAAEHHILLIGVIEIEELRFKLRLMSLFPVDE